MPGRDMTDRPPLDLRIGDVLTLRKPHACGGRDWEVVRTGTDIGLRCLTCHRRVLLERRVLERSLTRVVAHRDSS